jgi:APA family basic amino acid/polyamine antiporter
MCDLCTSLMFLAVVPLQEIATAPADRIGVVASQYIFGAIGTLIIAVMIMISTLLNNGLIMTGARVYYYGSRRCILQKRLS